MHRLSLIPQSRRYYQRFYRMVVLAVILLMAVLSGSLVLGDSVRGTLMQRVSERLGKAETVIASGTGFLSDDIMHHSLLSQAQGYLLVDGFISHEGKLLPVYVWGTEDDSIPEGSALLNEPLVRKLGLENHQFEDCQLVLHLPSHNLVPSGSLFVTKSYGTQMNLQVSGVKDIEHGGNMLLKNEQTLPLNVFVNRRHLAEVMEMEGKINVILSEQIITENDFAEAWTPALSGLKQHDGSLTSDRIFIQNQVVEKLKPASRYFSYLVNDIICQNDTVPYPFVTAVTHWQGKPLTGRDMILSDYAADHLHVGEGDSVRMSYFLSRDLKNLETAEQKFRVKAVVPLADIIADTLLTASFPGLSNVERCTDWDSDLPIKMDHIHKEDEDFWYQYHQTPKALVAYESVIADWGNSFGTATALIVDASLYCDSVNADKRLTPQDLGIIIKHPRAEGLFAASHGTDFSSLFLALGFFIILSAILLMQNPLAEMFAQRGEELHLYLQLGFNERDVRRLLFREAFSVMALASPVGVLAGVAYSALTLWLLGNVWSGATHTEGFALHVLPLTLLIGWVAGLVICALSLWIVVRRQLRSKAVVKADNPTGGKACWLYAHLSCLVTVAMVIFFCFVPGMVGFILCGLSFILTFGLYLRAFLMQGAAWVALRSAFGRRHFILSSLRASRSQQLLAYWSLSFGVFTVFAVGLNRPDFHDPESVRQATFGAQLYVESRVPIQYDLNNPDVRHKLALDDLPADTRFRHFLRHTMDEASCLNLNQVSTPTILSEVRPAEPQHEGFLVDQEALIWSLMKSVGDTLYYNDAYGARTPVVIDGTYPTGIFHGNALMSESRFRKLWPEESGVEVLLVETSEPEAVGEILSVAMGEYGLEIHTAEERLLMFFEVTDTYLLIFLTLGAIGMLLGIFSMLIILRKNLLASRRQTEQMQALGFTPQTLSRIMHLQNVLVPIYAVVAGVTGAFVSICTNITGAGLNTILLAFTCLALLLVSIWYGVRIIITNQLVKL